MMSVRTLAARLAGARNGARRSLVVAALAALLVGMVATPAHAARWDMYDNFESSPQNRWTITGGGHFSNHPQWAYSGSRYAYLVAWPDDDNPSVSRTFNLPSQHWRSCRVSILVRAVNHDAFVWLVAGEAGTQNEAEQAFEIRPSQGWVVMQVFPVPAGWGQSTRVTVYMAGSPFNPVDIRVDDLRVWCWT